MLVKSVIDTRRANRFGKYPVKILFSDKGKRKYISLGIYADLNAFDEASGLLTTSDKKTQRENSQDNNLIIAARTQINDFVIECRKANKPVTPDAIVKLYTELNTTSDEELHTFNSYFRKIIESRSGRTVELYSNTLKKVEKYFPATLQFEDIDKAWLKSFIQKMRKEKFKRKNITQEGLSLSAQSIHLRNIRAVFNEAMRCFASIIL